MIARPSHVIQITSVVPIAAVAARTISFPACIRKGPNSDYGVEFPDVPGCVTAGPTLDQARVIAAEALGGHLAALVGEGLSVPNPSSLDRRRSDRHHEDAVAILVDADADADILKAERVNVMIPRYLLGRIDLAWKGNRSRFLVEAAERQLASSRNS